MTKEEIKRFFDSFKTKKVLIIGDVMLDSYQWGHVERISPEAPVPVVKHEKREHRLGGAANVAINLDSLGVQPFLCGIIGSDDTGTQFLKAMQENHLDNTGIQIVKSRPTTSKTRIIATKQQIVRIDEEVDLPLMGNEEKNFMHHIIRCINSNSFDAIIFQDYDKGALTPNIIRAVIYEAKKHNIPTLVDPKRRNFMAYADVSFFKPNWKEFLEGAKVDLQKDKYPKIAEAAFHFQNSMNIGILMITLSEKGVIICSSEEYQHVPAHARDITDVSGAGDTVISVATLCLASALPVRAIAEISNLAGGMVCEKPGVVPIEKKRLEQETLLLDLQ